METHTPLTEPRSPNLSEYAAAYAEIGLIRSIRLTQTYPIATYG